MYSLNNSEIIQSCDTIEVRQLYDKDNILPSKLQYPSDFFNNTLSISMIITAASLDVIMIISIINNLY